MIAPRNGVHIVAETDHYQLLNLDNADSRLGFQQFNLVLKQPIHKANWWLGWNGERLARNHDARLLYENNPEVFRHFSIFQRIEVNCPPARSDSSDHGSD
jgi:hypothetical protein